MLVVVVLKIQTKLGQKEATHQNCGRVRILGGVESLDVKHAPIAVVGSRGEGSKRDNQGVRTVLECKFERKLPKVAIVSRFALL